MIQFSYGRGTGCLLECSKGTCFIKKYKDLFGPFGNFLYLCSMINCNTPISALSHKEATRVVELTFSWCVKNLGVKKKKGVPSLKVSKKKFNAKDPYYGDYVDRDHRITIYPSTFSELGNCVRKMIAIVIHEYAHTLQKGEKTYNKMYQKYGYWNHPMEIEARAHEKLWNLCYRDIKSDL